MKKLSLNIIKLICLLFPLVGCEQSAKIVPNIQKTDQQKVQEEAQVKLPEREALVPSDFMSAQWTDLLPKDDLDALLNPPEYLNEIPENSAEDQLSDGFQNNEFDNVAKDNDPYQKALASTRIIAAVNNVAVKMPAFIVPLEFNDEQKVTQFFMVPYFGACMHMPPPPPNQTIYVNYPQGFTLESISEPYLISGVLKTTQVSNDLATAAYSMDMYYFKKYYDD